MVTKKLIQRNVTHVMFDPENPEHKAALKRIAERGGDRAYGGNSEHTLIQFFKGEPVGFTDFEKEKRSIYVNNMYLLPEYRDVRASKPLSADELKAHDEEAQRIMAKHTGKRRSELPLPAQKRLEALRLARSGWEQSPTQLGLARKMARYLAKRHSASINFTADHLLKETIGEDIGESVRQRYTSEYCKRRSKHQPRQMRQRAFTKEERRRLL